ncbi:hypothetical protein BG006_007187 [Podila minutissima]|uniref:Protein-S-isoprenylcysteine O-methyltransferase n=1 Tax=Podila minutissima TaxID=64525 RepID=A0A9P5VL27_9FUNG|nr:hypothetical protein BG006_007187 [Podila minutissima]
MIIKSLLLLANTGAAALSVEPIQSPTKIDALNKEGEFLEEYVTKQGFRDYQRGLAYISVIAFTLMALGYSPSEAKPWFIITSVAGILGSLFRIWAMYTLDRFFTFKIMIRSDHRLVKTGPYRYLLHPAYTGLTIGIMSITLTTNYDGGVWSTLVTPYMPVSFLGEAFFVGLFVVISKVHWDRIQGEEKMMADHFGPEWKAYARRRYRMLPFVF